ncbi:PLP-dependent aminotransferase family protein [Spirillospora sp. NPDC047279]|uniref:aminotransferase-like domain-containing protein n=1 Tax=Spirillospora sp. NPDC047279 TaxID=3155478 RepID=UPI0033CA3AEF
MDDYRAVADAVAADITAGRLRPGDRLATQRAFARERGIAGSTAARVYKELVRRGLVVGEVGRGTFVRSAEPVPGPALSEPTGARVDLELTLPAVPGQAALLAEGLRRFQRPEALDAALRPATVTGTAAARDAVARLLARDGWRPDPARLLFAGNARQAIGAALSALVPAGERLGVEAFTYPVIKSLAGRLGIGLVPIATDEHGLSPAALAEAHRLTPLRAVYLQPTLQNPFSTTMPAGRRAELAGVLRRHDLHAVEDTIWAFLPTGGPPPLAAVAPDRTIMVDSVSKRVAPGLTAGFAVVPAALTARVATAVRAGAWLPAGFALDAVTGWINDGTIDRITGLKRDDVRERQRILAGALTGFELRTDPLSYFCWWDLPAPWRAETFVAAAARRGIAVTPAAAFAVGSGSAPHAVRFGLASPPPETLARALGVLGSIARGAPEDTLAD